MHKHIKYIHDTLFRSSEGAWLHHVQQANGSAYAHTNACYARTFATRWRRRGNAITASDKIRTYARTPAWTCTAGGSGPSAETDLEIYVWCSDQLLSLRKWAVCPQFTIIVVSMHNKNNMKILNTFQIQYFVELFVSCFFVVAELFPGLSQDNVTFLAIESPIIDTWQFYIEPHMLHKTGNWSKRYAQNMRKSPLYIWHTNTRENITNPSIVI